MMRQMLSLSLLVVLSTATVAAAGPYKKTYPNPLVQNTYTVAVDSCFYDSRKTLAADLGVAPTDLDAIARAYALVLLKPGVHRDVGYVGCLEGLLAPGAGQRKQFGRSPRK